MSSWCTECGWTGSHAGSCSKSIMRSGVRTFETGATRDSDDGKFDYEGFLSPIVLERFASYMHEHRIQSDGSLRASDNWQRGIPISVYMKSKWRHFMETWGIYRRVRGGDIENSLCAELFNTMGMLHEVLRTNSSSAILGEGNQPKE